jgi:hypothetical protein
MEILYLCVILFLCGLVVYHRWRYKVWNWNAIFAVFIITPALMFSLYIHYLTR